MKLIEAERNAQQQVKDNQAALLKLKAELSREHEVGPRLIYANASVADLTGVSAGEPTSSRSLTARARSPVQSAPDR